MNSDHKFYFEFYSVLRSLRSDVHAVLYAHNFIIIIIFSFNFECFKESFSIINYGRHRSYILLLLKF